MAEFQFPQSVYEVSEDTGVVSVCLELVTGILTKDVLIEVMLLDSSGSSGCEYIHSAPLMKWIILYSSYYIHHCYAAGGSGDIMGVMDFLFPSGTRPLGSGSLMCLNISIFDDAIVEPPETFFVCGSSQQTSVVLLNGNCAIINIEDNEGKTTSV